MDRYENRKQAISLKKWAYWYLRPTFHSYKIKVIIKMFKWHETVRNTNFCRRKDIRESNYVCVHYAPVMDYKYSLLKAALATVATGSTVFFSKQFVR